jgi:hypothetical protein
MSLGVDVDESDSKIKGICVSLSNCGAHNLLGLELRIEQDCMEFEY